MKRMLVWLSHSWRAQLLPCSAVPCRVLPCLPMSCCSATFFFSFFSLNLLLFFFSLFLPYYDGCLMCMDIKRNRKVIAVNHCQSITKILISILNIWKWKKKSKQKPFFQPLITCILPLCHPICYLFFSFFRFISFRLHRPVKTTSTKVTETIQWREEKQQRGMLPTRNCSFLLIQDCCFISLWLIWS